MRRNPYRVLSSWLVITFVLATAPIVAEASRVPGVTWMQYADPTDAGFDAAKLEAAHKTWQGLPSSAFMVVADGAVVAAWGDVERRFMCHSVRKSFLSALYGIYWDRGEIELNKRLSDLGIDDYPDPLLPVEREARILDLLKARSGVFHPAAYAGRTDSQPRGSQGPGRYFAYNNWDFNTLATILMQETGEDVFEAFDQYFGQPLQMQDWRVSDGYYHYQRDLSRYPAYPFRMSARDAARFGLLFAREGLWGPAPGTENGENQRILSHHWVRRSSALYSIDSEIMGYGFMWWVFREPRFERHGMYSALGVGNQMIAVLPEIDMVIVNRADTYAGERTPMPELLELIEQVLEARTGRASTDAELVALEPGTADPLATLATEARLAGMAGEWPYPPAALGMRAQTSVRITPGEGWLEVYSPNSGTFQHYLQPDGSLHEEDSHERYFPIEDADGNFSGIADSNTVMLAALGAAAADQEERARQLMVKIESQEGVRVDIGRALLDLLTGQAEAAEHAIRGIVQETDPQLVEQIVGFVGYNFFQDEEPRAAGEILRLNTRVFPESYRSWGTLGSIHATLGETAEAIRCLERSLKLHPDNPTVRQELEALQAEPVE